LSAESRQFKLCGGYRRTIQEEELARLYHALPMLRSNVSGQSSQPIKLACRSAKSPARPD
jgi:hypothetical protein